jgi:hypothetical protein
MWFVAFNCSSVCPSLRMHKTHTLFLSHTHRCGSWHSTARASAHHCACSKHAHTLSISLFLSLALSLTHTHTNTHTLSLSLSLSLSLALSLSLTHSLTHTHARAHTHTHTHTHGRYARHQSRLCERGCVHASTWSLVFFCFFIETLG